MLIKIQPNTTVSRYLFTAKSLYMFRESQHPSSGVLKTVTVGSGTGHNIGTATSLQRGRSGYVGVMGDDDGCCDTRNM
jgi:sugar/nucleoside kinase (ribokinase family)